MPKENDLEGQQDMGGKHGGQKGMPRPEPDPRKKDSDAKQQPKSDEPRLE
jgi:hypothetical protein